MSHPPFRVEDLPLSRRDWLRRSGMGFGVLGLAGVLASEGLLANPAQASSANPMLPRSPHFPARARRVVHLFMNGGPSHVDTFDPKPMLDEYHGKPLPSGSLRTERKTGGAFRSPFKFHRFGKSGIEVSEIFPHVGACIDDICVVRSMHADVPNHEPSLMLMNCGDARMARPTVGAWVTYGLGSENQNLPAYIAMCPGGYPIKESENWRAGFLPGVYQATYINTKYTEIDRLIENIRNHFESPRAQRRQLDLLRRLNEHQLARHGHDGRLESRIQSFELAYRMQMEASDAFDVRKEPKYIREMYGHGTQGRQMLITRRLLERGVRYIQLWHGQGQPWDSHEDIAINHRRLAQECDQAIAALLRDLKQRGLLDETLVMWGGEFGRTPTVELPGDVTRPTGRDHNHYGFTMWLAGGGVRGGTVVGATDEFGFRAVQNPVHVHDLHATILALLGFDHERLTYRYAGRDFRLTDVYGHVVNDIIA